MIEIAGVTKRFGAVEAVHDLSFVARPGRVTGLLGRNGAGKTATLRMLLGLCTPSDGVALVQGQRYRDLARPTAVVGALLEGAGWHPGHRARDHLRVSAAAMGVPARRVDEVLEWADLTNAGRRRVGGFSLGMRQRLGLATALLSDPSVIVLDEPANGLDPAGIVWLRQELRRFAAEGRTVLVSTHQLAEAELSVDDVVIVDRGRHVCSGELRPLLDAEGASSLEELFFRSVAGPGTVPTQSGDPRGGVS